MPAPVRVRAKSPRRRDRGDTIGNLWYWHASEDTSHDTTKGWAPVETADNALADNDDW
jgi:hypothetical protein